MATLRIVVDTSVLYAAAIRDSRVRSLLMRPGVEWAAPPSARRELLEHADEIAEEMRASREDASKFLEKLLGVVDEVAIGPDDPEAETARRLIGGRDPTDIPFVALALRISALGVWSLDRDFDAIPGVRRLSTGDIAALFDG